MSRERSERVLHYRGVRLVQRDGGVRFKHPTTGRRVFVGARKGGLTAAREQIDLALGLAALSDAFDGLRDNPAPAAGIEALLAAGALRRNHHLKAGDAVTHFRYGRGTVRVSLVGDRYTVGFSGGRARTVKGADLRRVNPRPTWGG